MQKGPATQDPSAADRDRRKRRCAISFSLDRTDGQEAGTSGLTDVPAQLDDPISGAVTAAAEDAVDTDEARAEEGEGGRLGGDRRALAQGGATTRGDRKTLGGAEGLVDGLDVQVGAGDGLVARRAELQ